MECNPHRYIVDPPSQAAPTAGTRLTPLLQSIASVSSVRCGQAVVSRAASVDSWYCIISGAARRCAIQPDGKRQIVDLLLPGDFFVCTALDAQSFAVEAIAEGTLVACYPSHLLKKLAESDPRVAREIYERSCDVIRRLHEHILVLGRTTTRERVAAFVLRMAERLAGKPADKLVLPMSRYDIADYLAISVETVSRSLTALRRSGAISLSGARRVRINDRHALEELGSEDGWGGEKSPPALVRAFDHHRATASRLAPLRALGTAGGAREHRARSVRKAHPV